MFLLCRLINTVDNLHKEMTEASDNRDALDSQVETPKHIIVNIQVKTAY